MENTRVLIFPQYLHDLDSILIPRIRFDFLLDLLSISYFLWI